MTNNGIYTVGLDQNWWYFTYFLRIFLWSSWFLAREIYSNEMRKLIEILPNALALGCQKVFKRCIGTEFCGNWRNFKKKRVEIEEKTCFFVFFMKNRYENTISIPTGIKNTTLSKPEIALENAHQNTVNWWLDRFGTPKMKASGWFRALCENRFLSKGSSYFLGQKHKNTKKSCFLSPFRHFWEKRTYI